MSHVSFVARLLPVLLDIVSLGSDAAADTLAAYIFLTFHEALF